MNTTQETPLRRARKAANLTASQLAEKVNVWQSTISRIERGEVRATAALAEEISRALGGRVSELEILYPERYVRKNSKKRSGAAA